MSTLLVHGVYDQATWNTLKDLGIKDFGFDLRGRSSQLITLRDLRLILTDAQISRAILIFENDKEVTILSFLNILKDHGINFILEFRDKKDPSFYEALNQPFIWMFDPEADWKKILVLKNLQGVILPLKLKNEYQKKPELWNIIEARHLEVFVHASSLSESKLISFYPDIKVSVDLSKEDEDGFRHVNQQVLKHHNIWKLSHESFAR